MHVLKDMKLADDAGNVGMPAALQHLSVPVHCQGTTLPKGRILYSTVQLRT